MTRDELEFSISQYLDGTLAETERGMLESRLGSDADARTLYADYESLDRAMKSDPLPAVNWDNLSRSISAAVAREEMPATSYKINRWLRPMRLSIAASVALVVAGIAFTLSRNHGTSNPSGPAPVSIVKVDNAQATETGVVSSQPLFVAIGPPTGTSSDEPVDLRYADSVVQRPSKALIVSAAPAGQDSSPTPF